MYWKVPQGIHYRNFSFDIIDVSSPGVEGYLKCFNKIFPRCVNSPTHNQISFLAHVLQFQKNLPDKIRFLYLKPIFWRSLVWSEVEVSVFYSLPVFQFIPNFFQIYFQFASNSPCFQFLSHVAAISSEMNSCKKNLFLSTLKACEKEAAVHRVRYKFLPFTEMEPYVGGK